MKISAVFLSLVFATAVATAASAAPKHHHHHAAAATEASSSDWPGNPHMDLRAEQVNAFWRDAFNPAGAK